MPLSESSILIVTAIVIGAGTGLGAVLFIKLIGLVQTFFFKTTANLLEPLGRGIFIIAPVAGALVSGSIIYFFAKEAKGHGVPEVMQAIALRGGRIRPRVVIAKVFASALCIGSGGSAGREGPIVQVGAALGSTLGQWLHLSESRMRNLVACGAAAGVAATFNAPISGVVFAMEIILGELHLGNLGNAIIAAVTASTISRIFLGDHPAFIIPDYAMHSPWEVLIYALLGLVAALVAVGFIKLLYWFEDRFDSWHFPDALKPAIGGLLLGGLAFGYPILMGQNQGLPLSANLPEVFGSGFGTIEGALRGTLPIGLLLALVFLKPLATSLTLGSGNSGGVFAPALFIGAALGGTFGKLVEMVAPSATAGAGAFAIVGMAAVFAGAARAPFTAILIVFEMTNDYRLIIPLMAGVIVSFILSEWLHKESIYTLKLARRGIHLQNGRDVDVMETVRVEEVMVKKPMTVGVNLPVHQLATEFLREGQHGFPVIEEDGSLFGVISLEDYRRATTAMPDELEALKVRDIASYDVISVFPDETVGSALRKMAPRDLSRLPVVDRQNPRCLVGVVRRNDIVSAYDMGITRREEARHRLEKLRVASDSQAQFMDVTIERDSMAAGEMIANLNFPRSAVLVLIKHGREQLIPHGDTKLRVGDVVTVLCESEHKIEVENAFKRIMKTDLSNGTQNGN